MRKLHDQELETINAMPDSTVPFVTMPCGCIGIRLDGDNYLAIINCDGGGDGGPALDVGIRTHNPIEDYPADRQAKAFKPVSKEEFIRIIANLRQITIDASAWQTMRQLINYAEQDAKKQVMEALKTELADMLQKAAVKAVDDIKAGKSKDAATSSEEMPVTERAV